MKCWGIFRRYWYWFATSVALSLVAGYIYQQAQDRIYKGEAVILIDESQNNVSGNMRSRSKGSVNSLMQLNGISVGDNLENELYILSSLRLMKKVVASLNLEVDYTCIEGLHRIALYRDRPFSVKFERPSKRYTRMEATINEDNTVTLTNFEGVRGMSSADEKRVVKAALGVKTKTPIGVVTVNKELPFAQFPKGKTITIHHYDNEVAARIYREELTAAEYSKESSLLVLNCTDINKDRAEDILYEVCNVYKSDIVDNKNRVAQRTAEFIDDRLELIGKELSQVEQRLASFKQNNRIVDMAATATTMTQQALHARQKTTELETELAVATFLSDHLRSMGTAKEVIPAVPNLSGGALAQQIAEYNRLVLTRNRYAVNSNEETPAIRDLDRQLESLRNAINSSLVNHVKSIALELRGARNTQNHFVGEASGVPIKEKEVLDISRQQNLKEALYTFLLNKREEVALQLAIEEANVRVVEEPMFAQKPIAPRKNIIMLIALLIGLLLPALAFWFLDLFDNTISGRQDIEAALDIPIAGELPHIKNTIDSTLVYEPETAQNNASAEAFRLLRYGLHFMNRAAKVYLVTSATPGQGKSFVSRNLAASIAMTGKKVVLIDTDVRKQNLTSSFGKSRISGLTKYLVGDCDDIKEIIRPDGLANGVDFISAGPIPPNVSELLMSDRLEQLIGELRKQYDFILLDTTPCFAVADASIVSRVADITLFVMRVGVQTKHGMPAIGELYRSRKIGNICLIINDSDIKALTYGYGYGYGYGYDNAARNAATRKWWQLW